MVSSTTEQHHRPFDRVLVTGATGFIGRAVVQRLVDLGYRVEAQVRDHARARRLLGDEVHLVEGLGAGLVEAMARVDGVINLAGSPLFGRRWTTGVKAAAVASRVEVTRRLVEAMGAVETPPRVLVSGSAVGYYPPSNEAEITEAHPKGKGFLPDLVEAWERAALEARTLGTRVVLSRTGLVLGKGGGMLEPLLPLFRRHLGGPLGKGDQMMPWIHLDDAVMALIMLLEDESLDGPTNVVGPQPVTNRHFSRALADTLGAAMLLSVPSFALRVVFGEGAPALLEGHRAIPRRLLDHGLTFEHTTIEGCLGAIVGTPS